MKQIFKRYRGNFLIGHVGIYIESNKIFYLIIGSILLMAFYYFIRLPISGFCDTDLWYHLNGGRYFIQHKEIPHSAFFSFIADSREWSNYYWLFQVLVYQTYSVSGYYGLIFLKALIFLATLIAISCFLLRDEKNDRLLLYLTIILLLYCFGLIPRYFAIFRPHTFSYLFIALSLYILESRSRKAIFLPIIAILWANLHGIEYPVLILLGVSYLSDFFFGRLNNKTPLNKEVLLYVIPIVLFMWAILLNPYGFSLLDTPFSLAGYQHVYINELRHIKLEELLSLKLYPFSNIMATSINLLLIVACLGCIKGIYKRNIRISHLILFIGGMILLSQAERFRYEAVLLALPVLKSNPLISTGSLTNPISKPVRLGITLFLILISLSFFNDQFEPERKYPFSHTHLPRGIAIFLNHIKVGGSVLNDPNHGGFLQWALDPGYKIFMDLEMVLFKDEDLFLVYNAFNNRVVQTKFIEKYQPHFIIGQINNWKFKKLIKHFPEYRVVFFDNTAVLYVNKKIHPQIALKYELTEIDPYSIPEQNISGLSMERINALLGELLAMYTVNPEGALINLQIGRIYKERGDLDRALSHANTLIDNYPELPAGYQLKGDIFLNRKSFSESIFFYNKAIELSGIKRGKALNKTISLAYSKIGNHQKAYEYLKRTVDIFSPLTTCRDLYRLGNIALIIGKVEEAMMLFKFAYHKTHPKDKKLVNEIRKKIDALQSFIDPIKKPL